MLLERQKRLTFFLKIVLQDESISNLRSIPLLSTVLKSISYYIGSSVHEGGKQRIL